MIGRLKIVFAFLLLAALVACGTVQVGVEAVPPTAEVAPTTAGDTVTRETSAAPAQETETRAPEVEETAVPVATTTPPPAEATLPVPVATTTPPSAEAVLAVPVATTAPPPAVATLPAPIYYINADDSQIWRVEVDGITLTQVTDEDAPVAEFDVSPHDGALVYVSGNQLIYASTALGGTRSVLIPGNPDFVAEDYLSVASFGVSRALWSPDGSWIAFGESGINVYLDPGAPRQEGVPEVRPLLGNDPLPSPLPAEGTVFEGDQRWYRPLAWSSDGKRLLVEEAYYFALGRRTAILDIETGTLSNWEEPAAVPCCFLSWGRQSDQILYAGNMPGMFQVGLWRVDSETGDTTVLVPGERGGEIHLFAHPFETDDGRVLGFYAGEPASPSVAPFPPRPMVMVSVAGDGSAELQELAADYFVVGDADWLQDGSGAVISDMASGGGWPRIGPLRWLPADGRPAQRLLAEGSLPQWGFQPPGG